MVQVVVFILLVVTLSESRTSVDSTPSQVLGIPEDENKGCPCTCVADAAAAAQCALRKYSGCSKVKCSDEKGTTGSTCCEVETIPFEESEDMARVTSNRRANQQATVCPCECVSEEQANAQCEEERFNQCTTLGCEEDDGRMGVTCCQTSLKCRANGATIAE